MSKKQYDDDDGRVIASMDVDGMPWYLRRAYRRREQPKQSEELELSRSERFALFRGVLSAALLIFAVFTLGFLAVILLMLWNFG